MNTSYTKAAAWVGCVLALILGAMALVGHVSSSSPLSASTNNVPHEEIFPWGFGAGIQIGTPSSAPVIKETAFGTCTLAAANSSSLPFPATSTSQFNCPVGKNVNIAAGDIVQVTLQNGHSSGYGAFDVVDATASTTATGNNGIITVTLLNNVGTATSSFPAATTSAQFEINRI